MQYSEKVYVEAKSILGFQKVKKKTVTNNCSRCFDWLPCVSERDFGRQK